MKSVKAKGTMIYFLIEERKLFKKFHLYQTLLKKATPIPFYKPISIRDKLPVSAYSTQLFYHTPGF